MKKNHNNISILTLRKLHGRAPEFSKSHAWLKDTFSLCFKTDTDPKDMIYISETHNRSVPPGILIWACDRKLECSLPSLHHFQRTVNALFFLEVMRFTLFKHGVFLYLGSKTEIPAWVHTSISPMEECKLIPLNCNTIMCKEDGQEPWRSTNAFFSCFSFTACISMLHILIFMYYFRH